MVIPTFNQADYLPSCVDHCLFQTYPNLEIIIVNGGSTDGTRTYLDTLEKRIAETTLTPVSFMDEAGGVVREPVLVYPQNRRIHILNFDHDIGATATYNEGLGRASGEFCTYVVGDDLPHPHMIEALAAALESNGVDFVYSDMNVVDDHGRIIRQMRLPDYSFKICFARWYHLGVSHLYRTKWHGIVGLMDEEGYKSANDYDHYLRFAMKGARFYHLSQILYSVRHHGEDRKTGQHASIRYQNLIEESKRCAFRARSWLSLHDEEPFQLP